jgi:hypothetical protein
MCRAADRPLELVVRDDRPAMPLVIDRRPQVRVTLKQLAAEYRPQLHELRRQASAAGAGEERRRLKRQRRGAMKRYRAAKRAAKATLHGPFAW